MRGIISGKEAILEKGGVYIATSSITKNFVISGKEQVEMFVNAIEESAKNRPVRTPVAARQIKGEEEFRKFIRERNATNGRRKA